MNEGNIFYGRYKLWSISGHFFAQINCSLKITIRAAVNSLSQYKWISKKKIKKWLYSIFAKFHLTCDWFYRWVAFFRWNFNTIKCAYSAPKRAIVTQFFVKYKNLKNHLKLSISLALLLSVCIEILIPQSVRIQLSWALLKFWNQLEL